MIERSYPRPMPAWLHDAVFYEIYPQSFLDTNGDGIGDIPGITRKLPYIRSLGCNALWINPCFDSPLKDAGYDVRDYCKVAPRYGTNEDLYALFREAHAQGIRVLLDLVAGHTSEEHEWFLQSGRPTPNEFSGRYIWTDHWIRAPRNHPWIAGECPRNGAYMLNFFKCQPALNYGWLHPTENWQTPMDAPDALATRKALTNIMRFWLDRGADGFRVDMAASLVKGDDENKSGTCLIWREIRDMLDRDYPDAALVAEWSEPRQAVVSAGYHMDFYLDHWDNGYHTLMRDCEDGVNRSFFSRGGGDIRRFLSDYMPRYLTSREYGYIAPLTCNHDTPRPTACLDEQEIKLAYAFLFTLPGVPFLYYGDEIGMRYLGTLPSKEGGYTRTGSRTPMQWDGSANLGFSAAPADRLYLPVDPATDAPTVQKQDGQPDSLLTAVRGLLALRHSEKSLRSDADFEPLYIPADGRALVYRRGDLILSVNPSAAPAALPDDLSEALKTMAPLFRLGGRTDPAALAPQSFAVWGKDR